MFRLFVILMIGSLAVVALLQGLVLKRRNGSIEAFVKEEEWKYNGSVSCSRLVQRVGSNVSLGIILDGRSSYGPLRFLSATLHACVASETPSGSIDSPRIDGIPLCLNPGPDAICSTVGHG